MSSHPGLSGPQSREIMATATSLVNPASGAAIPHPAI
jgi:hypothetical protein